jgi:LacI family transcriptional regulator
MDDSTSRSAAHRAAPARTRSSIADVAALAGVSQGTVSNVVNHPERVTEMTRRKVERAIGMLDYTPSGLARSLAVGSMHALGLVLSDLQNSLFVDISRGAERRAREAGAALLLANSDGLLESEERYLRMFAETRVLATLVTLNDTAHYHRVVGRGRSDLPLVLLNYRPGDAEHCCVHVDNIGGARMAIEHLLANGRTRIAVVGQRGTLQPIIERYEGARSAFAAAGIRPALELDVKDLSRADGYRAGLEMLPLIARGEIDGVFAMADLVAAGIAQAVHSQSDLRIPEDVAIVGYDDNRAAWDSPTPLTTIAQPGEEMGYAGVGMALEEIGDEDHVHRTVTLDPALLVRASTQRA